MAKRAPKLTQNEIDAICEALAFRTAGPIEKGDGSTQPREVYESAHEKISCRHKDYKVSD